MKINLDDFEQVFSIHFTYNKEEEHVQAIIETDRLPEDFGVEVNKLSIVYNIISDTLQNTIPQVLQQYDTEEGKERMKQATLKNKAKANSGKPKLEIVK